MKSIRGIAIFLVCNFLLSCSATPNIPVTAGLTADAMPQSDDIEKIEAIAVEEGFVPVSLPSSSRNILPIVHGSYVLPQSRITLDIMTFQGKFEIIICDPGSPGPFESKDVPRIMKFEIALSNSFPGLFRECHWNFDEKIMECARGGHIK